MPFSVPERHPARGEQATAAPQAESAVQRVPAPPSRKQGGARGLRPSQVAARSPREVLLGTGQPLAAPLREEMEQRLGADFSTVRVHADGAARASAVDLGARAYTAGDHVVVGDGNVDKHTLAHELAHVVQQRQGPVAGTGHGDFRLSDPADTHERAAEAIARRAMSGTGESDPGASRPGGGLATARPLSGEPAIQRAIKLKNSKYARPADYTKYESARSKFDDLVGKLLDEFDNRIEAMKGAKKRTREVSDDTGLLNQSSYVRSRMNTLLREYWDSEEEELSASSVPKMVDLLITEIMEGGRKSVDQQMKADEIKRLTEGSLSEKTRGGQKNLKRLRASTDKSVAELRAERKEAEPPHKRVKDNETIHSGAKPGFSDDFYTNYWGAWKDWSDEEKEKTKGKAKAEAGRIPCFSPTCKAPEPFITSENNRTIDHQEPWNILKGSLPTTEVCKDGYHWKVILQKNADLISNEGTADGSDLAVEEMTDAGGNVVGHRMNRHNLQPMHKGCNSAKSAMKGPDSSAPQLIDQGPSIGKGPHGPKVKCTLDKAI